MSKYDNFISVTIITKDRKAVKGMTLESGIRVIFANIVLTYD